MNKCPPGVICIEKITCVVLLALSIVFACMMFVDKEQPSPPLSTAGSSQKIITKNNVFLPSSNYLFEDASRNPYMAPVQRGMYASPISGYHVVGILSPTITNSADNVMQLMGRVVNNARDKWQYYAISNQYNSIKLPLYVKTRSASQPEGVDKLYTGDTVYVEGYDSVYRVTVYDTDAYQYSPFVFY